MIEHELNGPIMPSSKSKTVQNDEFLTKLEAKLIELSEKYGLGEVLFMERNPLNMDSLASFYIRAPKSWPNQKIFDVWDLISDEVDDFAEKEGCDNLMEICNVAVSDRY
jgi:hypothetical protein